MKLNRIICFLLVIVIAVSCCGCNMQIIDTHFSFNYAVIKLPDGEVIEGEVQSWKDFDDGDQIQVKIDGVTYLTHISNVVLEER